MEFHSDLHLARWLGDDNLFDDDEWNQLTDRDNYNKDLKICMNSSLVLGYKRTENKLPVESHGIGRYKLEYLKEIIDNMVRAKQEWIDLYYSDEDIEGTKQDVSLLLIKGPILTATLAPRSDFKDENEGVDAE